MDQAGVVIYATGSAILVDVEESLYRARVAVVAGVQNRAGPSYLSEATPLVGLEALSDDLKRHPYLVPLFTPAHRQEAAHEAEALGFTRPFSLIDASVAVPRAFEHAPGLYVNSGCSLGAASEFGAFVFVNRGSTIGHHVQLGSFVSIGPGVVIGGLVTIGSGAMVGTGSVVLPSVAIGQNAVVAAGAVVTRDVPDRTLVVGNPARVARRNIAGYNGKSVA